MKFFQVNAFTGNGAKGNPAGVCLLAGARETKWMQQFASDVNFSETAFLSPVQAKGRHEDEEELKNRYDLRWFTPVTEVDLCGHATLASAHILWEEGCIPGNGPIYFETRSGTLSAIQKGALIELDFPSEPALPCVAPPVLLGALKIRTQYVGKNRFDYLVEVDSEKRLRAISPDFDLLATLPTRGIIVTSHSDSPEYDFVSRFFAPRSGINEDPVTGSAHCCLAPFWQNRLFKNHFVAYQASERGGILHIRTERENRITLGGQAITILRREGGIKQREENGF